MQNKEIKYFIYARKSTEGESRQILSIESQMEEAQRTQERERLTVVGTFADSKSAKIPFNRPEYASMIEQIKKCKASGIIVWKIDRLTRNHLEGGELVHLLKTGIIRSIWTPQREYQSSDSSLLISLEASMAAQYSDDLSQNVKRGLSKKIQMGQPPLIARVGYLNTKFSERGTNKIIVDKKRWPLMRMAFDMMITGRYTMAQIVATLNDQHGFRTRPGRRRSGVPLAISVLHRAFTDPFYTGQFYYKGILHKGEYKPMITMEEYEAIQEVLGRKEKPKPHKHLFALTGLMRCESCDCAITASRKLKRIKATGEYRAYGFYHCTKRKGASVCASKRYIREAEMEDLVISELKRIAISPTWKAWVSETIKEMFQGELDGHQKLLSTFERNEQKLHAELETLLDLRISGVLDDKKYNQKKAEREMQIIILQEKHHKAKCNVSDWMGQFDEIMTFSENIVERFKTGNPALKRDICRYVGWNWKLSEKTVVFTPYEWFNDMEKLSKRLANERDWLELKNRNELRANPLNTFLNTIGCALREHIRTLSLDNKQF